MYRLRLGLRLVWGLRLQISLIYEFIYIYIYIYIVVNPKWPVSEIYRTAGQTGTTSGTILTPLILRLTKRERERERERSSSRWNAVYLKAWTKKFNSNGLLMTEVMAILWAAKLAKIREFKNFIVKEDAKSCFHALNGALD